MKKRHVLASASLAVTALTSLPNAQAQTWNYQRTSIQVSGKVFSTPERIVYESTTYMPIYYVGSLLESLGMTQSWNGTTHLWSITTGTGASLSLSLDDKAGNTSIIVDGQTVAQHVVIVQATDPDSGVMTTFMPIWYVQQLLNALGFTTDNWNGSATPPTWTLASPTPIQPKVQAVKAFSQALGISPDASGSNPYDDVSASDWGYVHAAVEKGYFTADSSTHFGSSDAVTIGTVDTAYWNCIGIPADHAAYQPGQYPYAWGQIIGLNNNMSGQHYMTPSDITQMETNLGNLQRGYYQDNNGVYHLVVHPMDEGRYYNPNFPSPAATWAGVWAYQYTKFDSITIRLENGNFVATLPPLTKGFMYSVLEDDGNQNLQYSYDGGKTFTTATGFITDGLPNPDPYIQTTPVLVKSPESLPLLIMSENDNNELDGAGVGPAMVISLVNGTFTVQRR